MFFIFHSAKVKLKTKLSFPIFQRFWSVWNTNDVFPLINTFDIYRRYVCYWKSKIVFENIWWIWFGRYYTVLLMRNSDDVKKFIVLNVILKCWRSENITEYMRHCSIGDPLVTAMKFCPCFFEYKHPCGIHLLYLAALWEKTVYSHIHWSTSFCKFYRKSAIYCYNFWL